MPSTRRQQLQQLIAQNQALIANCESQLAQPSADRTGLYHTIEDARDHIESCEEELAELGLGNEADLVVTLNAGNFSHEVIESELPVLVDCWAEWCGPCLQLSPIVDELSREFAGKIKFGKLNVDEAPGVAAQLGVQSLPALVILHKQHIVDALGGVPPMNQLRARLERVLKIATV
jgi:thioredoxin 1